MSRKAAGRGLAVLVWLLVPALLLLTAPLGHDHDGETPSKGCLSCRCALTSVSEGVTADTACGTAMVLAGNVLAELTPALESATPRRMPARAPPA